MAEETELLDAFGLWLASVEGQECAEGGSLRLQGQWDDQWLPNRLRRAFMAGAAARFEITSCKEVVEHMTTYAANTRPASTSDVRERAERAIREWFAGMLEITERNRNKYGNAFTDGAKTALKLACPRMIDIIASEFASAEPAPRTYKEGMERAAEIAATYRSFTGFRGDDDDAAIVGLSKGDPITKEWGRAHYGARKDIASAIRREAEETT